MEVITIDGGDPALIGYARVSTRLQDEARQIKSLTGAGCERIYLDRVSGNSRDRAGLDAALDRMRPGDQLIVHDLSRLGRNTREMLEIVDADIKAKGRVLRTLTGPDPSDRLTLIVLAALHEIERERIVRATVEGLEVAREKGRTGGRRRALSAQQVKEALLLRESGRSLREIAATFGVGHNTVKRALDRAEPERDAGQIQDGGEGRPG